MSDKYRNATDEELAKYRQWAKRDALYGASNTYRDGQARLRAIDHDIERRKNLER